LRVTQIVVDVVAVISARIIFEDRRQPNGGTAKARNIIKVVCNALDFPSVKVIGRLYTGGAPAFLDGIPRRIIMKSINE